MEKNVIKSIRKGWGSDSIDYYVGKSTIHTSGFNMVDEIVECTKQISEESSIVVYRGYINNKISFEMAACNDITIEYK